MSGVLHVLLHMAEHPDAMTSEMLARAMGTNPVVIRRLMAGLRERGFVRSEKGHGGGWTIACDLGAVTLLDVYEAESEAPDAVADKMEDVEHEMRAAGMWDAARYLRAVRTGASPNVIREALSFGKRTVTTKTIRDYRNQVRDFVEGAPSSLS